MSKTILIIEDDLGIRSSLQELYESEGYSVLVASNGRAGLDLLDDESKATLGLILLDLMMPVMSGAVFLAELQRAHPALYATVPVFVISAAGDAQLLTVKPTGCLKKPLDLEELTALAKRHCH